MTGAGGSSRARIVLSPEEGEKVVMGGLGVPHAFWNAGDNPARALEIISPAGFERYFAEVAPLLPPNHTGLPDEQAIGAVMARYGLEMDMASIPVLVERHGLVSGEALP
jgi:hypothetical protein